MLLQPSVREKGLSLLVDYDLFLPTLFVGDPGRIRQVLTNLVGNAVKFTSEGHVLIRVTGVPNPDTQSCDVHVAIENTGIGIDEDKIGHIFGEFNQVEDERNRAFEGTGLGLAITKRLITLMGGAIWVDSEPGQGSCFGFRVSLPTAEGPQPAPPDLDGRLRHVMIVEDLAANCAILSKQLGRLGVQVTVCTSGREALTALDHSVDLLLCDHDLPDMDGLELAVLLKDRGWGALPIVVMSANPGVIHAHPARHLIEGVLQKPIPRAELYARLKALGHPQGVESLSETAPINQAPNQPACEGTQRIMRVLAAEDNRTNQLILKKMVKDLNIDLRFAGNGIEAVQAYQEFDPDLIFMDISMPKMDGKQATAEIRRREIETGRHVPIVALTAHAMAGDDQGILSAGLDHYLTKPLQKQTIHQMVLNHRPDDCCPVVAEEIRAD
ncbi:Signal transduction histidine-protein kinase BarA [Ruegeria atlantica]|uniref:histidine kinase n=1 Tax=Ruegeria atlantica TaxID=81569 RepID=A0A0P1E3F4_9RHOB|nr:Signal transduction histidine-protein kinase BarA [Ruegeria atlantica]